MKSVDCFALYDNAEFYDSQTRDYTEDLEFYRKLADEAEGDILELACGTGRISLDLAARGHCLTGVDINGAMLERARQKANAANLTINWILSDIRNFELGRTFKLIFLPFNSICHIHDLVGIEGLFRSVASHLDEQGRFVVAQFIPNPAILCRDQSRRYPVSRFAHPGGGDVIITENNTYDPATQINHIKWYYQIPGNPTEHIVENNMRMYYPQEFHSLLHYNGFKIERVFGDYDMTPFSANAAMQIYVARRA